MGSKVEALTILILSLALSLSVVTSIPLPHPMMSPPPPPPPPSNTCNTTQVLSVCANLINEAVRANVGIPPSPNDPAARECCPLIQGLVDVQAGLCLCAAVKADVSPIVDVDIDTTVKVVLNVCNRPNSAIKCPNN
nr:14 kDa proline-rich protein DC2.15-like [Ipomoea batatas]